MTALRWSFRIWVAFAWVLVAPYTHASELPEALTGIGVDEHLGTKLNPEEFHFRDERGENVTLEKYFKSGRPVLLALVYFDCPNLCNLLLAGTLETLKQLDWTAGRQFEFVAVSFDRRETPAIAAKKKETYLQRFGKEGSAEGWHFLTGEESQSSALARQIGFRYRWDEGEKQFAHSAVLTALSPQAQISRYLYGIQFKPQNVKLALLDASMGKSASVGEKLLLFCFHFDPKRNSYTLKMWRIVQLVLSIQAVVMILGLTFLWKRYPNLLKKRSRR